MQVFVITNNAGMIINADVNVKNWLIKVCDEGLIWNPNNCDCGCDKSCDVGEYLDYENCKCRRKLVNKLIEGCTETVEEVQLAKIISAEEENNHKCNSCTLYIV